MNIKFALQTVLVAGVLTFSTANWLTVAAAQPATAVQGREHIQAQQALIAVTKVNITCDQEDVDIALLRPLVQSVEGRQVTLAELEKAAANITAYLRKHGYIVAQAYVPEQVITGGLVHIAVLTDVYDKIEIHNQTALPNEVITRQLGAVKSGAVIKQRALERAILLVNDLAGAARATLKPGSKLGTCNLVIEVQARRNVNGSMSFSNTGNRFTGKHEAAIDVTFNNATGIGDLFTLSVRTGGERLVSGRVSYDTFAFLQGLKIGLAYSHMYYKLGDEFTALDAKGRADVIGVNASWPFVRSVKQNLYGQLSFNHKDLQDEVAASDYYANKKAWVCSLGLFGEKFDDGIGGVCDFSAINTRGRRKSISAALPVQG